MIYSDPSPYLSPPQSDGSDLDDLINEAVAVAAQQDILHNEMLTKLLKVAHSPSKKRRGSRKGRKGNKQRDVSGGARRMSSRLCKHIVQDVASHDTYFVQTIDRAGKLNASPEQKVTAALRVLCYGVSADAWDEYVRMGESTINLTLRRFATAISELYGPKYLRSPTREDVAYYAERNAKRGLPGMFGSIDCCQFEWDM